MSERFRWLEYGDEPPPPASGESAAEPRGGRIPERYLERAREAMREGEHETALRNYGRALQEDAAQVEAWTGQVRCLLALGQDADADTWSEKAVARLGASPQVQGVRARVLARLGRMEEAAALSEAAASAVGTVADPWLWADRGTLLLLAKNRAAAEECFVRARREGGDDPLWSLLQAVACLETGHVERAASELQVVVRQRPRSAWAWLLTARAARRLGQRSAAREAMKRADLLNPVHPESAVERKAQNERPPTWLDRLLGRTP